MKMIAAGGFKDITRIASSSATMWQQICLTNTENITNLLSAYIDSLTAIRSQLDTRNDSALYDLFKGRTKCSKVSTIKAFCQGANITLKEFFDREYFNDFED